MNLGHAAALALVGWYLLTPPFYVTNAGVIDLIEGNAPMSKWRHIASFDTAPDCEAGRLKNFEKVAEMMNGISAHAYELQIDSANRAQCIASDDPRLKEK